MSIERIACESTAATREQCVKAALRGTREKGTVDVVVASPAQADAYKVLFADEVPCGARVMALPHWLDAQWELWGDGSRLVSNSQRHTLLRPILARLTGLSPSSAYVETFSEFVEDAIACNLEFEGEVGDCVDAYLENLEELGLTDPAQAFGAVAQGEAESSVVFVAPDESRPRMRRLLEELGRRSCVTVLEPELPCEVETPCSGGSYRELRDLLFCGGKGLKAPDGFTALEVHGAHAEAAAATMLVKRMLERSVEPRQIALVLPSLSGESVQFAQNLADEGIPVSLEFSVPASQTSFGAAFLQLEKLLNDEGEDVWNTIAFVNSAYSGLSSLDARGFASHWRGQDGSTHAGRLEDLSQGLKGRVPAKTWEEKLAGIKALLEEKDVAGRIVLMYGNAKKRKAARQSLADDAAVADAILDHVEDCREIGLEPTVEDIAALKVPLFRAYGAEEEGVRICAPRQLQQTEGVSAVVLARLDKDSYPMAGKPGAFDSMLLEAGWPVVDCTAKRNRIALLNALEIAADGFSCYRTMTGKDGADNCQSALWDELMTAFSGDADEGKPVDALPEALVAGGCGLRLSEAEVFAAGQARHLGVMEARRGEIGIAAEDLLVPDAENFGETFSPTAIEDYYRCPYRWFICRRVGANMVDKPFDQIAMGNLAHAVLERFYILLAEEGVKRVTPENLDHCLEVAKGAFEYQRQHEIDRHRLNLVSDRDWRESDEVLDQVVGLVTRDAEFLPGFAPAFLELKLEDEDGNPLEYGGVKVRGKVDRIDMDGDGNAVIIDYKLSGLSSGYGLKDEELPTRIQTDIYALMVQRCLRERGLDVKVVGSVYRSYAKNALRGVYRKEIEWGPVENVKPGKDAVPGDAHMESYEEYLADVESTVAGLMERMRAGDIEPDPLCKDACEYCVAATFCPKHEEGGR